MLSESIYEDVVDFRDEGAAFGTGDPREVFSGLTVYVEFDTQLPERQMAPTIVPGEIGRWVAAYSSLRRLHLARGDDAVEYSTMIGAQVLAQRPRVIGVWYDPCFPGGRPIAVPTPDIDWGP